MCTKTTLLPAVATVAILLGSGYVHGLWSFRWSAAGEIRAAAERLAAVPAAFGDWSGTDAPLGDREAKVGRIDASVSRRYVNARTGRAVTILLVCGRPGPIAAHSPEVCYAGGGYEVEGERAKVAIGYGGPRPAEFWSIRVAKPDAARPERITIDYGWFADGVWTAPAGEARLHFAGHPVLYKLYAIREQPRADDRPDFDPTADFLGEFLPRLQVALGGPDPPGRL
jgi:hypothetical protein